MLQIAYRRLLIADVRFLLKLSDQQSPIRNLEHHSENILIDENPRIMGARKPGGYRFVPGSGWIIVRTRLAFVNSV
jgi:hypothetical protein